MTLMNPWSRRATAPSPRRPRRFTPAAQPALEGLEDRLVLSHAAAGPAAAVAPLVDNLPGHGHLVNGPAASAQKLTQIAISNVSVSNLAVSGANTLTGNLNLTGSLGGSTFNLGSVPFTATLTGVDEATYPVTSTASAGSVSPSAATTETCPILHLSLQIPDLNLLGLHVNLDNCNGGPVTVDITAIPTGQTGPGGAQGGLLGDLLCSVDNALSGALGNTNGQGLLNLVGTDLNNLLTSVTGALNGLLGGESGGLLGGGGTGGGATPPSGNTATLIDLHTDGINLDVLGLDVNTSAICLTVSAQQGGGLLGDLLYAVDNLLASSPGNSGSGLSNRIGSILGGLLGGGGLLG